jgi:hypothetical protein
MQNSHVSGSSASKTTTLPILRVMFDFLFAYTANVEIANAKNALVYVVHDYLAGSDEFTMKSDFARQARKKLVNATFQIIPIE